MAHLSGNAEFDAKLNGMMFSLMSWDQLAAFWPKIKRDAGWYLYAIGEPLPDSISTAQQVEDFITQVDALLHRDHHEDYCGIVYADNLDNPGFIKIYDPNNLGVSCGSSKNPPLPGWIMCTIVPGELIPKHAVPEGRKRWWRSLWSSE